MDSKQKEYCKNGVTKVALSHLNTLFKLREGLTSRLQIHFNAPELTLEKLHNYISDEQREELGWNITNYFWKRNFCQKIAIENFAILSSFVGPDLYYQSRPFLRIARPEINSDNIGFHRDTMYGQSPYEVSVHVPLTNLDKNSCLRFWRGSHLQPDSNFETIESSVNASSKGSKKHEMGFPYAPKTFKENKNITPLPLKFGEAAIFPPSTIHGQISNKGKNTRVSFDFRILSAFAPIKFREDLSSRGYSKLSSSAVSDVANIFLSQNVT